MFKATKNLQQYWQIFVVVILPLIIISIFQLYLQLKKTSWSVNRGQLEFEQVSVCLESLKNINKAIPEPLIYSRLGEGIDCLKNLSFLSQDNPAYLNLISLSEQINHRENQVIEPEEKQVIWSNQLKLYSDFFWRSKEGFIIDLFFVSLGYWIVYLAIICLIRQLIWFKNFQADSGEKI